MPVGLLRAQFLHKLQQQVCLNIVIDYKQSVFLCIEVRMNSQTKDLE